MVNILYLFVLLLAAGALLSVFMKWLTPAGGLSAFTCGILVFYEFGAIVFFAMAFFFLSGSVLSKWSFRSDLSRDSDKGIRGWQNVLGNGGVLILISLVSLLRDPENILILEIMAVSSISAACSDTFASEIGQRLGRRFVYFPSLKKAQRGDDGAISLEGTIAAFTGALAISFLYFIFNSNVGFKLFLIITISGFSGNLVDSLLGATLERNGYLNKHIVNFLCTMSAAIISMLIVLIF
ncbi:DUF92 domain-containing protein [Mangrovivirga sp. M17]|uniref:DUF92 domain-containing protein n=1 Tax=Mangrovivirga halotolerans TaxID=2993936 RepID=A0ABT3RNI1_9BACT|nr:DUF92 domain-containing protein [Mangrovivirga halotolerans]MCX2742903.1 DUF92 domain-containing protein [Mangrovivirga halotolerans]